MLTSSDYLILPNGWTLLKVNVKEANLLDYISYFIQRYVILTPFQVTAITLWIIHTYLMDFADTTPYLNIFSSEKRSGKTRLLEVLEQLVNKPWFTGRVTPAVLARKIDKEMPTLLLDETDAAFKSDKDYSQTLRGILNTGYRYDGQYSVCTGQGANINYKDFSTFGPKALAGIGSLPDTITDRSIPIKLRRRTKSEIVEKFRLRETGVETKDIRDCICRWIHDIDLTGKIPKFPEGLDDRAEDVWEPLFAIADAAGGDWPEKARNAALELMTGETREDYSLGIRLLADIKMIIGPENSIFTSDLLPALNQLDESPWGLLNGRPLSSITLASLLRPYEIHPHSIRRGELNQKGYEKSDFKDAWERYLPNNDDSSVTPVTPALTQLQNETQNNPSQNTLKNPIVTDDSQSYAERNVTDVTAKTPKQGEPSHWVEEI
jgi:hypothetical protein